ncbi:MAG: hypothetical protein RMK92_07240 [Armatimonadota bacterium]|nr:hypothetical protein [Armatimonadota bacterium]
MKRSSLFALFCFLFHLSAAEAQMVTGSDMPGYAEAFGLTPSQTSQVFAVKQVGIRAGDIEGANVLWQGETALIEFEVQNLTDLTQNLQGHVETVHYRTEVPIGDWWVPHVYRLGVVGRVPVSVSLPPRGRARLQVQPQVPDTFGGYVLVLDFGEAGRAFGAALVRVPRPDGGKVFIPTFALDMPWPHEMSEAVVATFHKLGIKGCRLGIGYVPTMWERFREQLRQFDEWLGWAKKYDITVMLTIGEGGAPMPLGRPRPHLNDRDEMLDTKSDYAWLPEYDDDFQKWTQMIVERYGWPRGMVNAVELWNEPWEGLSISGWGADMPRYRELYTRMALGVEAARANVGVRVLMGGACSSSNTRDKLFCDGTDTFLKWLDFVSIHYQPLAADPALVPEWRNRKSPYGPVQVWDTESWVANSEDRVAAVIASMRAQGQQRTAGIYYGNVYTPVVLQDNPRQGITQVWAPAAAVAACQKFIGQRTFREILFKNGLPWIFVFDGLHSRDDGTVVVVGDLRGVYDPDSILFRNVLGLSNRQEVKRLQEQLARLSPDDAEGRRRLREAMKRAMVWREARLILPNPNGEFVTFDHYGNPLPPAGDYIVVPLDGRGYYLRTNGKPGSFRRLVDALRRARIEGIEPVEIVLHDLLAPLDRRPTLRLTVTNVLNRPVKGTLSVRLQGATLERDTLPLSLRPHETRRLSLRVQQASPSPMNLYPCTVRFEAGADGAAEHEETLRVNLIARRSIRVDGDLRDWTGVLPQVMQGEGITASQTEQAYLPFKPFERAQGEQFAMVYFACDEGYFYLAAKIADTTPYEGNVRFETRDDDAYYYPPVCYEVTPDPNDPSKKVRRALHWPEGVRRFSYRKEPDLPSGNGTDNVQVAFNVLPPERKPLLSHPPGTMPRFMVYADTDYEFALNPVAPRYGGGTEIWCLQRPGMVRKHFYPRQPKAPNDGGAVKEGQLVIWRDENTRYVEAAIPWSQMPEVRDALFAGRPVKISVRVNHNVGEAMELAAGRSVSKTNFWAFHNDWATHWANEVEFVLEP